MTIRTDPTEHEQAWSDTQRSESVVPAIATIPRMAIGCPDHGSNRSGADLTTKVDSFRAILAKEFGRFRPYACLPEDGDLSGR